MLQMKWQTCILLVILIFSNQSGARLGISISTDISDTESAAPEVISGLQSHEIKHVRFFDTNHRMLEVTVSIPNNQLPTVGESQMRAEDLNEISGEEFQHGEVSERMMYSLDLQSVSRATNGSTGQAVQFCVANSNADLTALQTGLNWACGPGGANCGPIQPGQPCYNANNLAAVASYAYNDYYQRTQANGGTCNFNNTASLTPNDPSSGSCIFTGSSGAGTNSSSGGGGTGTGTGTGGGGTNTNSSTGGSPLPIPPLGPSSFDSSVSRLQIFKHIYLVLLPVALVCFV